jgi:cytoskeletal protein CcmA (bactofilin family)
MSELRVRAIDEEELGTIISDDVEFDGDMRLEQPVLIRGKVKGAVLSGDDVFISEEAIVEADIDAHRVSIKGTVTASITARERIELFKTARVRGSIKAPDLIVQSGARFSGPCSMPTEEVRENGAER